MFNLSWLTPGFAAWSAVALAVLALATYIGLRVRFWIGEGRKLQNELGYRTPHVSWVARVTKTLAMRVLIFIFVGRYIVIDKKKRRYKGRVVAMCNHQIERDAIVVPKALGPCRPVRGWMAVNQIVGIRAPLAAWMGVIAVHHAKSPMAAVRATIKIMKAEKNTSLLVFPQGQLFRDNKMEREQFFAGATMIARKGSEGSELPFAILPMGTYYDRDPKHATRLHRFLNFVGFKKFRYWFGEVTYGVTLAFGDPIPLDTLPEDHDQAMDIVYQEIVRLSQLAEAQTKRRLG